MHVRRLTGHLCIRMSPSPIFSSYAEEDVVSRSTSSKGSLCIRYAAISCTAYPRFHFFPVHSVASEAECPLGTNQPRELKRHALCISRCSPAMPLLLISLTPVHFRRAMTRSDPHRSFMPASPPEHPSTVIFGVGPRKVLAPSLAAWSIAPALALIDNGKSTLAL